MSLVFGSFVAVAEISRDQSWQSFFIEYGARVFLTAKRNADDDKCQKILEKASKRNEDYSISSFYIKHYKLELYKINGFEVCIFNSEASSNKCIYYLHGGAYVDQPLLPHFSFLKKLSSELACAIVMPIYPKAPNYTYESTIAMVFDGYQDLLLRNDPSDISIMGDSAGGGMALALCEYCKIKEVPQPSNVIMFSPCVDATLSIVDNEYAEKDPMISDNIVRAKLLAYAGDEESLTNYLVSPIYGDFTDIAPMTVFVGTYELLLPYIRQLKADADSLNITMNYYEYERMLHVFPLMPIPESREVRAIIKKIVLDE